MYREPRSLSCTQRLGVWIGALQALARRPAPRDRAAQDLEAVGDAASRLDVSAFEVFRLAYRSWYGATPVTAELEREFGLYLNLRIGLPFYVRRFLPRIATLPA